MKGCLGCLSVLIGLGFAFLVGAITLGVGGGLVALGLGWMFLAHLGHRARRAALRKKGWS